MLTSGPLPCEPYHWAKRREGREARQIVAAAAAEARKLVAEAIRDLRSADGYKILAGGVVIGRGRPDFTFQQALSTHAAMHNAEGWLFREALIQAGAGLGLRMTGVRADDVYAALGAAAGMATPQIEARIRELGARLGAPWGNDEKLAAAAAWLALARSVAPRD